MSSISVLHPMNVAVAGRKVQKKNEGRVNKRILSRFGKKNKDFNIGIPSDSADQRSDGAVSLGKAKEEKNDDLFKTRILCKGYNKAPNPAVDEQALRKALDAAMQTSRVAEILAKARGDKVLVQKDKGEKRKSLQLEDEESRIREAEELKKKKKEAAESRETEREAARVALEMMERTAAFEDNLMIMKELEMLSQCSPTYALRGCDGTAVMLLKGLDPGRKAFNPLERLGLRLKDESWAYDEDEGMLSMSQVEEGEILEY